MEKLRCAKCDHSWVPRTDNPQRCPKCQTREWMSLKTFALCDGWYWATDSEYRGPFASEDAALNDYHDSHSPDDIEEMI